MDISGIHEHAGAWLDNSGPLCDVVVSSRIRLARNLSGFTFNGRADDEERTELLRFVRQRVKATPFGPDLLYMDLEDLSSLERQLLSERHLISKRLAEGDGARGLALAHDESLAMMINEEDHLRIQVLASGLQLPDLYERINGLEDHLEEQLEYAFSPHYGYLTACPTNVGTGIRVSAMMHLPALKEADQMEKVFRAARDMRLAIRGLYGEGSDPVGDLYQVSNQTTLGKSEQQIIEEFTNFIVEPIIEYERRARDKLISQRRAAMEDRILRALSILKAARLISSEESLYMLSFVRLGIYLGLIDHLRVDTINELFLLTQPAHLQSLCQRQLDPAQRDEVRAEFIRSRLDVEPSDS